MIPICVCQPIGILVNLNFHESMSDLASYSVSGPVAIPCKNERVRTREKCVLMRYNTVAVSALDAANALDAAKAC